MKMTDNRADQAGAGSSDSPDSIRRAGGEDPRRYDAKIVMDRKIADHDRTGYNHQTRPNMLEEQRTFMESQEGKAADRGSIEPDGIFRR